MNIENDPALALSLYASTAASAALVALKNMGRIEQANIDQLIQTLTICRKASGDEPMLIEHAELLLDMLLDQSK